MLLGLLQQADIAGKTSVVLFVKQHITWGLSQAGTSLKAVQSWALLCSS